MRLAATLLACLANGKDRPDGFDEKAEGLCETYLTGKGATAESISFKYIAQGAQGAIYRCQTSEENITPNDSALKLYFPEGDLNLTRLEEIDTQLTQQGLRYPVYDWVEGGKFEEFLSGRRDLDIADFGKPEIRKAVAQQFARLHGGVVNNIDQKQYRNTDYKGWWNTYEIKNHFDVLFYLMDNKLMPGTRKELYELTKMSKSSLNDEILWVQKLVQDYYGDNEDAVVMCHNDLHNGNVMINKEGDMDLIFVDYDNAGYGYRAWDLLYNMLSWPPEAVNDEVVGTFLQDYVDERKRLNDTDIIIEKLIIEVNTHVPYVILERMVFAVAFGFGDPGYMEVMREEYEKEARKRGREVVFSSANHLQFSILLSLLLYLLQ